MLFDRTIAENIQYGDNSREVSMEEVNWDFKEQIKVIDFFYR